MERQLLIIGNGFDLSCGLKSTYNDFFRNYFEKYISNNELFKESGNFWFDYFWYEHERESNEFENWSDIENAILLVLEYIDHNYSIYNQSTPPTNAIDQAVKNKFYYMIKNQTSKESSPEKIKTSSIDIEDSPAQSPFPNIFGNGMKKEKFFSQIFEDLIKLENEFAEYLSKQSSQDSYKKKSIELIKKIIELPKLPIRNTAKKIENNMIMPFSEILSFNYTNINPIARFYEEGTTDFSFKLTISGKKKEVTQFKLHYIYENVHGSLDKKNNIFGIDGQEVENELLWPFTKTYRKMFLKQTGFSIDNNLEVIKFFGHSLAEADYSYFLSIFDAVDLYNGKVILIFYYKIFDENRKKEIVETQINTVYKLIRGYGKSLSNQDHGQNIVHKLLLEGRLRVEELK